ncbi:MAG: hypothetical protein WCC03_07545 [Candidatus Acidiferrales bacterium]
MSPEQRKTALDVLDDVQKRRQKWEFVGAENELIQEREKKDAAK